MMVPNASHIVSTNMSRLSEIGCPIIGDEKYDARTDPAKRLGLHACLLKFRHPITGKELQFESPLPPELARLF